MSYAPKQLLQKSTEIRSPKKYVKNTNSGGTIITSPTYTTGIGKECDSNEQGQKQKPLKVYVKPKPKQLMLSDLISAVAASPPLTAKGNANTTTTHGNVEKTPYISSDSMQKVSGVRNNVHTQSEATKWKKNSDNTIITTRTDEPSTVTPSPSNISPRLRLVGNRATVASTTVTISSRNSSRNNDIKGAKLLTDPNNTSFSNKGKPNRLTPRKKKLTSLKKRILTERLQKWKDAQLKEDDFVRSLFIPSSQDPTKNPLLDISHLKSLLSSSSLSSKIVCLVNFIDTEQDDLTDEDEYNEICSDVCRLARLIGPIHGVCIPRPSATTETVDDDNNNTLQGLAFVNFQNLDDAHAARYCWRDMVFGGRTIDAILVSSDEDLATQIFLPVGASAVSTDIYGPKIALHNILNQDDLADSECMEETLSDIRYLISTCLSPYRDADTTFTLDNLYGDEYGILINFSHHDAAIETAINILNGLNHKTISGKPLAAEFLFNLKLLSWNNRIDEHHPMNLKSSPICHHIQDKINIITPVNLPVNNVTTPVKLAPRQAVVLSNILSDDDMEDDECLDECKEDILSLVRKYGDVSRIHIWKEGLKVGNVLITYASSSCAEAAAAGLNGLKIGGKCISAEIAGAEDSFDGNNNKKSSSLPLLGSDVFNNSQETEASKTTNNAVVTSKPIFSKGGKLISERWAECKRVPKIGSSTSKPVYVHLLDDDAGSQLLLDMLGSLMSYQLRSKEDANARSRRRLVLGFREVARGLRAKKIKMVVLANNLDEYEAVSEKTLEVIDACQATETPILFELSKRQLGKALGKTIKIAVVGVQNADGAHEQFKKLKALVENARKSNEQS